ncbi:MAG: hypothetical protein LBD11_06230 [Candidatus Peribacteria bacterium]|nr:hypothetical protein [Candidatus Peribacteria bacterium]
MTYTPSTDTNGSVTATLTVNETVTLPTGRSGNATGTTFTRVYNTNETTSVAFYDLVGNLGSTGISITRIDTVKPGATVTYSPTTATSGTVTATLTTDKTITLPAGRSGNATGTVFTKVYTANENSSFIITDPVGNTGEATVIITRIDKTAPEVIGLTYTPASYTNTDVEVSIETSEPIYLPAGRNGNATGTIFTKIFSANTGIILDIYDLVYNQGSTGITINRIDKTAVTGTITYGPNTDTNTDVTATISFNKIPVTVTNNGGNTNYTFTGDGSFTFEFVDQYGNTGSETATVTRIDKTAPTCTIDYNPSTNTNQDVIATLTGCSETVTPYPQSYTFTGNGSYTFNFADLVGNT